jgi:hypothetical protein
MDWLTKLWQENPTAIRTYLYKLSFYRIDEILMQKKKLDDIINNINEKFGSNDILYHGTSIYYITDKYNITNVLNTYDYKIETFGDTMIDYSPVKSYVEKAINIVVNKIEPNDRKDRIIQKVKKLFVWYDKGNIDTKFPISTES